jgi:glyoxylase-like metal-dependent hydrolase (beta-lactamase superfamily II)
LPALVVAWLLVALPAGACDMLRYQPVRVSAHVHAFLSAEGTTGVVNGNIVAIVGRDSILVVDTGQFLGIARDVIGELRRLSSAPVRYIVNTHWHGDHLLANSVFRDAYPQARILAHRFTIAEADKRYADYSAKQAAEMPKLIEQARKRREATKSEDEKLWIDRTVDCAGRLLPDMRSTRYVAPDTAVDKEMRIDLGGVTAVVRHVGTGNTEGDLIVWVEEDRVVATGDMVVAPSPYAIGSAGLDEWVETLGDIRKLGALAYVPGHGPVMRDDAYIRDLEALLSSTRSQLAAMKAKGLSKAEAIEKLDTSAFRARHIDTPMRRQAFERFFVRAAVEQAWGPAKP